MRSLKFPTMFVGNNSAVWKSTEHLEATKQNTKLLLNSLRGEILGDPYFGITRLTFDQNSQIMQDALADIIYTQLALFMPQIRIKRSDIKVTRDKALGKVICTFRGVSQIDYSLNTYEIVLFEESDSNA